MFLRAKMCPEFARARARRILAVRRVPGLSKIIFSGPRPQEYYLGGPGNPSDIYICPKMHEFNKFLDVIILHPKKCQINAFWDTSSCQTGSQALVELLLSVVDS